MMNWNWIMQFQDKFYPDWMEKPRLLYSNALAGESGEVCGVVTHLDGGGTNNKKYTEEKMLEECVDTYIQLVLLIARSGFTPTDFANKFDEVKVELEQRLTIKCAALRREKQ